MFNMFNGLQYIHMFVLTIFLFEELLLRYRYARITMLNALYKKNE